VIAPPAPLRAPRRTIRLRLTLVYAALFLVSGAVLLTITYLVVADRAPGPKQVQVSGSGTGVAPGGAIMVGGAGPAGACVTTGPGGVPAPGQLPDCVAYLQMQTSERLSTQAVALRAGYQDTLLITSGIALGVMTVVALGLGWLVSGRALRPLRTITMAARSISASSLHQRLALAGPDDELKELGDTVDGLLARLEGSFAAQRQFVANASHELRTPLARQRTLVEVALADPDRSVDSLAVACGRVLAAGEQQERLIEALLTLARSQRGLDHYERVDLAGLAREVTDSRVAEARQRGVELSVRAAGAAVVAGDRRLAERLITNLVDNAIRHNVTGGSVTVTVGAEQDPARQDPAHQDPAHEDPAQPDTVSQNATALLVANTGPVINQCDVGGLFEPFRRGGRRRTGDGDSPGLGLSIVGAIAAAHGAGVWATARQGGGLEVRVAFPCLPGQPRPVTMSPAMPSLSAG
jgi:signal transduction histidine kinase